MRDTAYLVLENGAVFEGRYFGAQGEVTGELVFTTGMTGYIETLTDPSFYGQIVLQTFPLIGNYGVIPSDFESPRAGAAAYIVKSPCQEPSNFRSEGKLDTFLRQNGVIGLCGVDTRAITKILRERGVMNGRICSRGDADITEIGSYSVRNPVKKVSVTERTLYKAERGLHTVALIDFGMKENIKRELLGLGCDVWVMPCGASARDIMSVSPDGIVLSNGPGDPMDNAGITANLKELLAMRIPVFGICLGHQLLALANGFKTHKLKYGHRGTNQPVRELRGGRIYTTSQNHGYAVTSGTIDSGIAEEWFVNVNDGTCEGIIYKNTPAFSVQFHPEGCGGPRDTGFLFRRFVENMQKNRSFP